MMENEIVADFYFTSGNKITVGLSPEKFQEMKFKLVTNWDDLVYTGLEYGIYFKHVTHYTVEPGHEE